VNFNTSKWILTTLISRLRQLRVLQTDLRVFELEFLAVEWSSVYLVH
jgi:hypothetical protein